MNKDEMKNKISMALKDPILQQGFEIFCKENAELKEKLGDIQMQKAGEKSDLIWKLKIANEQKADQLTKAKEIIKELMSFSVQLCDCRHTVDFEKTREEAEQFLNENSTYERIQKAKYNYTD